MSPKPIAIQPMFDGLDAVAFKPKDGRDRPGLYLEECSYQAAKYAVEHWHYSEMMPRTDDYRVGVWEESQFIGCVIFGRGANGALFAPFGLTQDEGRELIRVALSSHSTQVSRVSRIATLLLRRAFPETRLLASFADPSHGHHGGIYQAGGWVFTGITKPSDEYIVGTDRYHGRALRSLRSTHPNGSLEARNVAEWATQIYGVDVQRIKGSGKFRYLYPLDSAMRAQIEPLRKPYPKCVGSAAGGTAGDQLAGGGSIPTPTLLDSPS